MIGPEIDHHFVELRRAEYLSGYGGRDQFAHHQCVVVELRQFGGRHLQSLELRQPRPQVAQIQPSWFQLLLQPTFQTELPRFGQPVGGWPEAGSAQRVQQQSFAVQHQRRPGGGGGGSAFEGGLWGAGGQRGQGGAEAGDPKEIAAGDGLIHGPILQPAVQLPVIEM